MMERTKGAIILAPKEAHQIKNLRKSENMVVLRWQLAAVVRAEEPEPDLGSNGPRADSIGRRSSNGNPNPRMEAFAALVGYENIDSYYRFIERMKKGTVRWLSLDEADVILCRLGIHWKLNTDEIVIYKIIGNKAYPLRYLG